MTPGLRPKFKKHGEVDHVLEDLIAAKNYKQAFALCDKRLKKSNSFEEDAVARCHVLLLNPDSSKQEQGRKSLQKLLDSEPPLRSIFALTAIVEFAHFREEESDDIKGMWARALKAHKVDEAWFRTWFKTHIYLSQWSQAAQAATRYMQQFKDSHRAYFLAILAKYLDCLMPQDEKSVFSGPVAYKLLSTAAGAALDSKKPTVTNNRSIKTSQDLLLLLEVYEKQKKFSEALNVLEYYSNNASFVRNDWEFARRKLKLLYQADFRTRQWEFCVAVLNSALPDDLQVSQEAPFSKYGKAGNDWWVWKGLLSAFTASAQIEKDAKGSQAIELIKSFLRLPDSRNARLAAIALHDPGTNGFFEQLCSFIRTFCSKSTCFRDIRPYIQRIEQDQQWPLLQCAAHSAKDLRPDDDQNVNVNKWIIAETTALKLDYYFGISQGNLSRDAAYYRSFIATCLRLCKTAQSIVSGTRATDRKPADDVMVLAIVAMHRYAREHGIEQDFKMVALLEHLLKRSRHNYEAILLAVQLYLDLGFGSLAMESYSRLNIKNIQQGSMPWVLMTRISLIHPLPIAQQLLQRKISVLSDPLQEIQTALLWYESAEEKLTSLMQTSLDNEQYHMVYDMLRTNQKTMHGRNRYILFFEGKRITRFSSNRAQEMRRFDNLYKIYKDFGLFEDRDYSAFVNYEYGGERNSSSYRGELSRPFPKQDWFKVLHDQCRCWDYMMQMSKETLDDLRNLLQRGSDDQAPPPTVDDFTAQEKKTCHQIGANVALAAIPRTPERATGVAVVLENIWISHIEGLQYLEATCVPVNEDSYACEHLLIYGWEWLSDRFLFLDLCHFSRVLSVMLIADYINDLKSQELYLKALKIRLNIESASKVLEDQVLQVREKLVEGRELDRVIRWIIAKAPSQDTTNGKVAGYEDSAEDSEDSLGALLYELVGEEDIQQAAEDLIESWAEALYGLAEVAKKLRGDKPASKR